MQFLVLAHDAEDAGALDRRKKMREGHLANARRQKAMGNFIFGGALLAEDGEMAGSAIIYEFPDRAALDAALAADPYVEGKVWHEIIIYPYKSAPI